MAAVSPQTDDQWTSMRTKEVTLRWFKLSPKPQAIHVATAQPDSRATQTHRMEAPHRRQPKPERATHESRRSECATTTTTATTHPHTDAHAWSYSFIMALCQRITDVSQCTHLFLSPASPVPVQTTAWNKGWKATEARQTHQSAAKLSHMHRHAAPPNFIFTDTDRLVEIFSHYRLGTEKCRGYWTCGWKTKVRAAALHGSWVFLFFFLLTAGDLGHSSSQCAAESVFNQSWFFPGIPRRSGFRSA